MTELTVPDGRISSLRPSADTDCHNFESMTLVPILTSFVASLQRGSAFRVSVHSWEKPNSSNILRSYKTPDETVMFEARVYIDGALRA